MITPNQAQQVLAIKQKVQYSPELQTKKQEFFDWLNERFCDYGTPTKQGSYVFPIICYNPQLKCCEMWNTDKGSIKNYKGEENTRTKVNSETCLETDKIKDFNTACSFIAEVCSALIRNAYHFFVWYAQGQRSPHIRIYDLDELCDLNPQQRIKAQIEFWKRFVPFGMFHLIDTGVFVDNHTLQMEYAPHWKYGSTFDLLFEYNPQEEKQ